MKEHTMRRRVGLLPRALGLGTLTMVALACRSDRGAAHALPPGTPNADPRQPAGQIQPNRAELGARSSRAIVVTDSAIATRIGIDVLKNGGNAVDALVSAAFALAVAFPCAGNIGGGGFLVARQARRSYALDFRETAPAAATRNMYLGPDGKPTRDSRDGWRSAGVPGSVLGLWEAWRALGSKRKSWRELLQPSVELAERGFVVDEAFVATISEVVTRLAQYPASTALFLPNGAPPVVGSLWRNPELANVLRRIADGGPAGFYEGPVAQVVTREMKENGGLITESDLRSYRPRWRTPIETTYRTKTVVGMPPPSSGGVTIALIANVLSGWDLSALGWHSVAQVHLAAEAMRRAFAARNAKLGDPDFVADPTGELFSERWIRAQRATISPQRSTPTSALAPPPDIPRTEGPHTTHLAAVDDAGTAAGLTTTVNAWYGSGATVPGLGFVLNDEMDDFATVPGTPNMFGLIQGEANAIAPGKRMLSSMSPTLVLGSDGDVELVLGAAGGSRIITTVFEELSNVIDFGLPPEDAVRAPRFHQQDYPDVLFVEPQGLSPDVIRGLESMGHVTKEMEQIGDAPAIGRLSPNGRPNGWWQGAAEPRRKGSLALGL